MDIDWQEVSKRLFDFALGGVTVYFAHRLLIRRERERLRRNILISCYLMMQKGEWYISGISEHDYEVIVICAVNDSQRPVTLVNAGFYTTEGRNFHPTNPKSGTWDLPRKLEDGEMASFIVELSAIVQFLQEKETFIKSVYVTDALGKIYQRVIPDNIRDKITGLAHEQINST